MRHSICVLIFALVAMVGCEQQSPSQRGGEGGSVQVCFSPKGGATEAVVRELNGARKTVRVQAYSFTSQPIAKALVEAKKRGVDVEIVVDKSQRTERYTEADFTANQGIPTYIDSKHAIAHNKIVLIDGETILTGSFNFTKAAEENNAENLLILKGFPDLVRQYERNYERHKGHAEVYRGKGEPPVSAEGDEEGIVPIKSRTKRR